MANRKSYVHVLIVGLLALAAAIGHDAALAATSPGGVFSLSASTYTVTQNAGSVTVTVNRTDGSSGAASVRYHTTFGTALDGINYVNTYGLLTWADGNTSPKTFSVKILDQKRDSKVSFTVQLSTTTNAVLGAPALATITITPPPSVSPPTSIVPPTQPTYLLVTGQSTDSISLNWSPVSPGSYPIAYYQVYRNGEPYDTTTAWSYTDTGAINATNGTYASPATIYSYAIAAVDTQGVEGPQTTQSTFNVYANGTFNWQGDYSYSAVADYKDTSGAPEIGTYDIEVTVTSRGGGFQPYAGNMVPTYDLEAGSFGYLYMDLKPTINGQTWRLSAISRLPPGDVYPWAATSITDYGPAPQAGQWATYKIPLSALSIGMTSFTGSISGNKLTVTRVSGGVGVDAGGFVSGAGVAPGTYITGYDAEGGAGTYTVYPSQNVASTSMTEQRTAVYKIDVVDESGASINHYYVDRIHFSRD
jgi:hypothetical protein